MFKSLSLNTWFTIVLAAHAIGLPAMIALQVSTQR